MPSNIHPIPHPPFPTAPEREGRAGNPLHAGPHDSATKDLEIENRSDSGQFRSKNPQPSTLNPQPPHQSNTPALQYSITPFPHHSANSASSSIPQSALHTPHSLWSLQPNEPAADYKLFAAWLQLPSPRHFRTAASALGCSLYRLRRLSARHRWKTRAAAFDQYRANSSSRALDQLLHDETHDWQTRLERFRIQEWLLHEEMIQTASDALQQIRKRPGLPSLGDLLKIMDLGFTLGRLACGMPLDPAAEPKPQPSSDYRAEIEAALLKIYGPDDSSVV